MRTELVDIPGEIVEVIPKLTIAGNERSQNTKKDTKSRVFVPELGILFLMS